MRCRSSEPVACETSWSKPGWIRRGSAWRDAASGSRSCPPPTRWRSHATGAWRSTAASPLRRAREPEDQQRHVVGGFRSARELRHAAPDRLADLARARRLFPLAQKRLEAGPPVARAVAPRRLRNPVGDEAEGVAGLKPSRGRRVEKAVHRAQGRAASLGEAGQGPPCPWQQIGRLVAGDAVLEIASGRVEDGREHGDEESLGVVAGDLRIGLAHHGRHLSVAAQGRALIERLADSHEEAPGQPFARHVADHEEDAIVIEAEEIVEIAAYLARGFQESVEIEARLSGKRGGGPGQRAHLDAPRRLQLAGEAGGGLALSLHLAAQ